MAKAQPQPYRAFCTPPSKTLTVVPHFPNKKAEQMAQHMSRHGQKNGKQGILANRSPLEPAFQLPGWAHALHIAKLEGTGLDVPSCMDGAEPDVAR